MSESSFVKFRTRSNMSKSKSNNSLDENIVESETQIEKLSELSFGDHIVISVDATKYCHAIVDALNTEKNILDVIYYDNVELQCALDEYMLNGPTCELTFLAVRKDSTDSKSSTDSKNSSKKDKDDKKKEKKEKKEKKIKSTPEE